MLLFSTNKITLGRAVLTLFSVLEVVRCTTLIIFVWWWRWWWLIYHRIDR